MLTRINVGIDPSELPGQLLLTEHREITRIPNAVAEGRARVTDIPSAFCLGPGHVKFFYNKLLYLQKRFAALHAECLRRGYRVSPKFSVWVDVPPELMNDYVELPEDRTIILKRFAEKGFTLLPRRVQ